MTIGKPWYHVERKFSDWNWEILSRHRSLNKARAELALWEAGNGSARYRIVMNQEVK